MRSSQPALTFPCYNRIVLTREGIHHMPIYEYICDACNERFEKIVINKQQEISCPKCSSKKASIQLSVFATAGSGGGPSSPSGGFSGGGGGCCGGGCSCH